MKFQCEMSGTKITTTGVLYINGQQVENTFTNISKITKKLEGEFKKLTVGTEEWRKKAEELKTARARLEEVRKEVNAITESIDTSGNALTRFGDKLFNFGEVFKGVFSANVAASFFEDITGNAEAVINHLLEIADAMTDVEKSTGMTTDQVKELWDAFDEMNTRTSKLDRLKIAEVAGRLGVPLGEMKDFIVEIDKAYVALGDSFEGGLEAVVEQIGTIKGLFSTTKEMGYAEAINQIGSALNTLAAQGTASEGNISEFATRVGTLPDALKPSIDKVLGLGAAFEEAGINAEIGSSGLSNFLTTAGENIGAFAISMRMSTKDAQELLNTKPEEFFLRFAQGMKGLSATETSQVLESLKLGSLEVQKAVGAAANNTDAFRKSMKLAGAEMEKGSSLADEFNKKNNNAPAIIEKIKNVWNDFFTSTNIINKFEWLIQAVGWLTGVTSKAGDGVVVFKERLVFLGKIITILIASVISYNVALTIIALTTKNTAQQTLLYNIIQKAKVAWDTIARGTTLLYAAAQALLTGNTVRATAAMRAFNAVTKLNAIGLLVSVVTAAVTAYVVFSKSVSEAAKQQKTLNDITKEASQNSAKDISTLDQLYKKATDVTKSTKDRTDAVRALKEQFPDYFKNIKDEVIMNGKAEESYKKLRESIIATARANAAQQKLQERAAERLERDQKINDDCKKRSN